jgi:hypothetical protein
VRTLAVLILLLLASGQIDAAGSIGGAKIIQVRIDQDGKGMVVFDQPIGGTPASCVHPAYRNALSFDANTGGGRGVMAMALAAKASGAAVSAYGNGTCGIYGGAHVEDWSYGVIQ